MAMDAVAGHILASGGYDNTFSLTLTHNDGTPVTDIKAEFKMGKTNIVGQYDADNQCYWFIIPAEIAQGEHFYDVCVEGETLKFPQKITFMEG